MRRLTWALAAFALAGQARADVIFTNLGPGETYDRTGGWAEAGPNALNGPVRAAIAFTINTDAAFDSTRLAVGLRGGANEIDIRLYDDAGGHPGTVLESTHLSGQMPPFRMYDHGHLVTFDSVTHPLLQAGQTYWLLPLAPGDTDAAWNWTFFTHAGPLAYSLEDEPINWTVVRQMAQGTFEVNGTPSPVPESSGLVLTVVGAVTGLAARAFKGW
jgi:hypothetical protein